MVVTLVAINAQYGHTNLAVRLLDAATRTARPDLDHRVLELHINQPFDLQLRTLLETEPDAVCFSTYIWNRPQVLRLARAVRAALPAVRIALGGPEVSFDMEALLTEQPCIDAVLSGEGEVSYPALLGRWADASDTPVPGACLRDEWGCLLTWPQEAPLSPRIWQQPYDADWQADPHRLWYVETSRGCPFRCRFCLSAGDAVRALSAAQAIEILTRMARAGAPIVKLVDRTFNFDSARAREIWAALAALDTNCTFHFEVEAHLLDETSLALLATVPKGRFQFEIGVQSTCPEVLRAVGRGDHFPAVAQTVRRLRAADNMELHLDLIAGLPRETWESFAQSFDDVYALAPHMLQLGFLKLLPGSVLRRDAEALGLVYAPDPPYQVLHTRTLTFAQLSRLHDVEQVLNWYSNSGRYPEALAVLLGERSPFAVFDALARAMRKQGLFSAPAGEHQRIAALGRCAEAIPGVEVDALRAALARDAHRRGYHHAL